MINLDHKRIAVVFLMHLGDVVLTTPFVHALRKAAPHSHITYVMDKKLEELMRFNPYIDELVTVDKKGQDDSFSALRRIGRSLNHPDVLINLNPSERASFLSLEAGAKEFVGMSHFLFRPFMDTYTRLDRKTRHAADMYVNVLEQLGITAVEHEGLEVFLSPEWEAQADRFYDREGVLAKDTLIGFNVGSAVPAKRWPKERFAQVADHFAAKGCKIIFFGGPGDREMVEEVMTHMSSSAIMGTGLFSLGELAAAVKRCNLFITNDSGPMHVAVSQQVPVVALYGPSNPALYGPYRANAVVLESADHYDVGKSMKKVIRSGEYKGLAVITADQVIAAGEQLLTGSKALEGRNSKL